MQMLCRLSFFLARKELHEVSMCAWKSLPASARAGGLLSCCLRTCSMLLVIRGAQRRGGGPAARPSRLRDGRRLICLVSASNHCGLQPATVRNLAHKCMWQHAGLSLFAFPHYLRPPCQSVAISTSWCQGCPIASTVCEPSACSAPQSCLTARSCNCGTYPLHGLNKGI